MADTSNAQVFDLIIVGAGCAGASGGMYAARMNLKTLMIGELPGGLITTTHVVENWPGIKTISGPDLGAAMMDHALASGVQFANERVTSIRKAASAVPTGKQSGFLVKTASNSYKSKAILIATGTKWKKLGVPGEERLANKGVSYCALCDGNFFKGKTVCVVGSGDSAAKEALLLSELCAKVYLLIRGDKLKSEPINFDRVMKKADKIEVRYNTTIAEIIGESKVEKIKLNNGNELDVQGVFIAVGHIALSDLAKEAGVELNTMGEIMINRKSETNMHGVFAAGDVCDSIFKQAITGAAEAVTAAYWAFDYIGKTDVLLD